MRSATALLAIKVLHTAIWLVFVGCIVAIPLLGYAGSFRAAAWLVGIVMLEVLVLVFNRRRCPLTDIAARYTEDRRDNFDIFLPLWLARHNKSVFGTLFVLGTLFTFARWAAAGRAFLLGLSFVSLAVAGLSLGSASGDSRQQTVSSSGSRALRIVFCTWPPGSSTQRSLLHLV